MTIKEQLILKRNENKTIELKHYFSFIKISKMIVSGVEESKEILMRNMILRMTYKNGSSHEVKELYLASLISGKLPILEEVFELPYKISSIMNEEKPEKLFNEIELEFIFDDDDNEINLYIFFERSPGINIK